MAEKKSSFWIQTHKSSGFDEKHMSLVAGSIPGKISWTLLLTLETAMPAWNIHSSPRHHDAQMPEDLTSALGRCKVLHEVGLWGDDARDAWIYQSLGD